MQEKIKEEILQNLRSHRETAARVLHGRGKYFADCEKTNIEWYPPYLFIQNFDETLPACLQGVLNEIFESERYIDAVLLQKREWPDFVCRQFLARSELEIPIKTWTKIDTDLRVETSLGKNRNTGAFLDMRAGWHWLRDHAHNKRVLNLFSYTGMFSLFALQGGAEKVDNMDMAANVLKIAQRNHQQNGLHDGRSAFYKRDILKSQRWFESRDPYDIIVLDPPPYQKKAFRGWQDYKKLLESVKICLKENGILFCCLNNPQVDIDEFKQDLTLTFPEAKHIDTISTAEEIKEVDEKRGLKTLAVHF